MWIISPILFHLPNNDLDKMVIFTEAQRDGHFPEDNITGNGGVKTWTKEGLPLLTQFSNLSPDCPHILIYCIVVKANLSSVMRCSIIYMAIWQRQQNSDTTLITRIFILDWSESVLFNKYT